MTREHGRSFKRCWTVRSRIGLLDNYMEHTSRYLHHFMELTSKKEINEEIEQIVVMEGRYFNIWIGSKKRGLEAKNGYSFLQIHN